MMNCLRHILVVAYGGGHIKSVLPVVKKLRQNKNNKVTLIALTTAINECEAQGVQYHTLHDYLALAAPNAVEYGEALAAEFENSPIPHHESVAYLGIAFAELVVKIGVDRATDYYKQKGRVVFCPVDFFVRLIQTISIDFVLATNSPRCEKASIEAARLCRINSLCLIDLYGRAEASWIANNTFATKIAVLNEQVKSHYIDCGRTHEDIVVTGNPIFDELRKSNYKSEKKQICNKLLLDGKKLIVWASQPEPRQHPFTGKPSPEPALNEKMGYTLRDIAKNHRNWIIVHRPHPSEMLTPPAEGNVNFIRDTKLPLWPLLSTADVVITYTSTVGLEAAMLGTPLLCINRTVFYDDLPLDQIAGAEAIAELDSLEMKLQSLFNNDNPQQLNNKPALVNASADATATENVIAMIEEMVKMQTVDDSQNIV